MSTSDHELKKMAALALIEIDAHHSQQLVQDMKAIMAFVEQLRQTDTRDVMPLLHPLELHQRLRKDEVKEGNLVEALASLAPSFAEGVYLVPKVIETGK